MRLAEAAPQHLHEFERDPDAGQDGASAAFVALRIGHGHALGHKIDRFVVVGDGHADAQLHERCRLRLAGDAAVHRDDEVGVERADARDGGVRDAVALFEAPRDERRRLRPERAQAAREHGGGGDAVQVEVAEHDDAAVPLDDGLQGVGDVGKTGDRVGIEPVAVERGRKEAPGDGRIVEPARDERGRDEPGKAELRLEPRNGRRIGRFDVELGRHGR